jgi:hypothetical protein
MAEKVSIEQVYKEACQHCRHNPNAVKPYAKMKQLPLDDLTIKLAESQAKKHGLSPHCWICLSVTRMLNMPFEELLAKLKKRKDGKMEVMLDKETNEYAEKHNIDINEAVKQHTERLKTKAEN